MVGLRKKVSHTFLPTTDYWDETVTRTKENLILPVRLMVGLRFLVPTIGVRVPDRQHLATITRKG